MSKNIVANVREFISRLVKDCQFQSLLQNSSVEMRAKLLEEAGFSFTKSEFEAAAIELLEAKEQGQLNELSEDELIAVFGGCYEWNFEFLSPVSKPSTGCMHQPGTPPEVFGLEPAPRETPFSGWGIDLPPELLAQI